VVRLFVRRFDVCSGIFVKKFDVRSGLLLVGGFVSDDVCSGLLLVGGFVSDNGIGRVMVGQMFVGKFDIGLLVVDRIVDRSGVDGGDVLVERCVIKSGVVVIPFVVRRNGHGVVHGSSGKGPEEEEKEEERALLHQERAEEHHGQFERIFLQYLRTVGVVKISRQTNFQTDSKKGDDVGLKLLKKRFFLLNLS
jgi:hypothetical protein